MITDAITIRQVERCDEVIWKEMVNDYDPDLKMGADAAWDKMMKCISNPETYRTGHFVIEYNGEVIGFFNIVNHLFPLQAGDVCYLADLYVVPEYRQLGIATFVLQDIIDTCTEECWERVYWVTEHGNVARKMYDKVAHPDFVRYHIDL